MARRGRRGSLSPKTYFPATGDQIQNEDILWECAKSNTVSTPKGQKVRYAILLGFSPDSDDAVPLVVHDQQDNVWVDGVLPEAKTILRRIPGQTPTFRMYDWNRETSTWQQRLDDA